MKQLIVLFGLAGVIFGACSQTNNSVPLESFTMNGENITIASDEYSIANGVIYFAVPALESYFGLEFKDIIPGRQIGMCRADLCIPFEIGDNDPNKAYESSGTYFVPVPYLMLALGDEADWDAENRVLNVNILTDNGMVNFKPVSNNSFEVPAYDFSLNDLDGSAVSLSDYFGKKVGVFVWASW